MWNHAESALGGKVSLLVNNAGVNPKHGWRTSVNVMLTGVGYGTFLAIEKMGTSHVSIDRFPSSPSSLFSLHCLHKIAVHVLLAKGTGKKKRER